MNFISANLSEDTEFYICSRNYFRIPFEKDVGDSMDAMREGRVWKCSLHNKIYPIYEGGGLTAEMAVVRAQKARKMTISCAWRLKEWLRLVTKDNRGEDVIRHILEKMLTLEQETGWVMN